MLKYKKLHPNAKAPKRIHKWDAGFDMTAVTREIGEDYISYDTKIAVVIPQGWVGMLFPRSSISNQGLILSNSCGIIDSGFSGSVTMRFRNLNNNQPIYKPGDRVGQLVLVQVGLFETEEIDELPNTDRGSGGYGSTN